MNRKKVRIAMDVEWTMGSEGIGYYDNNGKYIASSYIGLEEKYIKQQEHKEWEKQQWEDMKVDK